MNRLPRLYGILDAACYPDRESLVRAAKELVAGGCTLLQYRNKRGNARVMLEQALELRCPTGVSDPRGGTGVSASHVPWLIMNDRADLCLAADFDGVHVGQDDL